MASQVSARIAALVVCLASPGWAATTLVGTVVRDHPQGSPVGAVPISARGAVPTKSGADGRFALTIDRARPGDTASLSVGGPDWAVVNAELLTVESPKPGAVVTVIVSRPAEVPLRRLQFYTQVAHQAIERSLLAQLDEGRKDRALDDLERRQQDYPYHSGYRSALQHVPQWAAGVASARPDPADSLHARALRLFANGHTEAALMLLSENRLRQEARGAQPTPDHNVRGWHLRAMLLLIATFDQGHAPANRALEQAPRLAPDSFDAWLGLATFRHRRLDLAEEAYARALTIARGSGRPADVALALHAQGRHGRDVQRVGEARSQLMEALRIRRELATNFPAIHLPDVAATLADLGWLNLSDDRLAEARLQFAEALRIRRSLATTDPSVHLADVAACLRGMGLLNHEEGHLADARALLEEALEIHRRLAHAHPAAYRPQVVATLYNLAVLDSDQGRQAAALARRAEAWRTQLALVGGAGATELLRARAGMRFDSAFGEPARGQAESRALVEESLQLHRELARSDPAIYQPRVGFELNRLGQHSRWAGRHADAKAQHEEALHVLRGLPMPARADFLPDAAKALSALGRLSREAGRNAEARAQLTESLAMHRQLERGIAIHVGALTETLIELADLEAGEDRKAESRALYEEVLQIYREQTRSNPAYLAQVARTLRSLAAVPRDDSSAEARERTREALQIFQELARTDASRYLPEVAEALVYLGLLDGLDRRPSEARAHFTEALQLYRSLADQEPAKHTISVARTLHALGRENRWDRRGAEAWAQLEEAQALYLALSMRSPGTLDDELRAVAGDLDALAPARSERTSRTQAPR